MKTIKGTFILILCLFISNTWAQKIDQCVFCKMDIKDIKHMAIAENENKAESFDAIECLINYLKENDEGSFSSLKVADYTTGNLIEAKNAIYLKSKAIPSPMGANLSAFKNKEDAIKLKNEKGGELFTWIEIKDKFVNSKFGAIDHSHHDHNRPDLHAPIGVMGDHLHEKGGLMLSFRYMNMAMNGNKSGSDNISDDVIYNNYMVAPQDMIMNMYMLGVMYAPSNKLTITLMQNYIEKNMDLTAKMMLDGMTMMQNFSTRTVGLGDLNIGTLYSIYDNHKTSLHLNGSLSIPIGDIENTDDTPMMNDIKLPYAMQLGSGTFDVTLGATFKGYFTKASFGTQFLSTLRTGKNSQDYRFGNIYQLNIWGAYKLFNNFSVSARFLSVSEGELIGVDNDLNPIMVTTADKNNYGSDKIKSFAGFNISFPETSSFKNFIIGFEAGVPIYENYNGVQMDENLSITLGLKYNVL